MLAIQLTLSFAAWIAAGILTGRRPQVRSSAVARPGSAALLGGLLFVLSAVVLIAGLLWVAQTSGPVRNGLGGASWAAVTSLGVLFTVGQTEAARIVFGSVLRPPSVTEPQAEPSVSSNPSRPATPS